MSPNTIFGQYSLERIDQLHSENMFVVLENNRNLVLNKNYASWFNLTGRTSLRWNDWRTNFIELVPNFQLYRNNHLALNLFSKISTRYSNSNSSNTNLSADIEAIYVLDRINILLNTTWITEQDPFLAKLSLGYHLSGKWTLLSAIGNSYEYNYIYNSLNFGVLIQENSIVGKVLVEFPRVDEEFSTKFSRVLVSIGTSL